MNRWQIHLIFTLVSSLAFFLIASIKLDSQGLYYDELLSAPGAFSYTGSKVNILNRYSLNNIVLFNTSYNGALKSAIYGFYLKFVNNKFTPLSWRMTGIIFVFASLIVFSLLTINSLKLWQYLLLMFFLITDISLLLYTRYDWAPSALTSGLKFIFLGVFIKTLNEKKISYVQSFISGLIIGLAVYEKLSSLTLLIPLFLMLFYIVYIYKETISKVILLLIGLLLGTAPIILTNIIYLYQYKQLFSFQDIAFNNRISLPKLLNEANAYLELGMGKGAVEVIFGIDSNNTFLKIESLTITLFLLLTLYINFVYFKKFGKFHISILLTIIWITIGILLFISPMQTGPWHYILGTPFQYLAIIYSLSVIPIYKKNITKKRTLNISEVLLMTVIFLFMTVRMMNLSMTMKYIYEGKQSIYWDISLTRIGEFAEKKTDDAIFIAADWGVASQIFSISNGKENYIYEIFRNYQEVNDIYKIIKNSKKKQLYIVGRIPPTDVNPENTEKIWRDVYNAYFLKILPLDKELLNLKAVKVARFKVI